VKLAWQIARSNADLYHVNYALQDAFLVSKLRHLGILHVHGSDLRATLKTKRLGWLVKKNLRNAERVLYATPDLKEAIANYRDDAVYLPTPIDTDKFSPKTDYAEKPKALYFVLPYESVFPFEPFGKDYSYELSLVQKRFAVTIAHKHVEYIDMPNYLKNFDVFVDRFSIPSRSKTCLEAMSCGLGVLNPSCSIDDFIEQIETLRSSDLRKVGEENREFIIQHHAAGLVANKLADIWREVAS
jgi:hypothetical protein